MSQNRRNKRQQNRNIKNGKARFVGLEFNLDGIPKEELQSLKIGTSINSEGIEAIIKTDKRTIETNSVKGYRKDSKPGFVLKKSNFISNSSHMGILPNLRKHDIILGIDTNTRIINGQQVHIGMALQINKDDDGLYFVIINVFQSVGEVDKPENQNWKNLIEFIMLHEHFSDNLKYVIVVDSDLGSISEYNKRTKAIVDDFFLPANFELLYASSDTANDELTNQLIAACDKYAGIALDQLKKY